MRLITCFVLIFSTVEINGLTSDELQLFSQCDRTVGSGLAACVQYFSPIKFVTDFLGSNKESLCCTHFRQSACIRGVRDAAQLAKAANLCSDSITDELVSTLIDSPIDAYIRKSCKSFNAGKCVMDSVGDVVNTIQGFFTPQQQKPVIPQLIDTVPQLFNRGQGNAYSSDSSYYNNNNNKNNFNDNHNYNTDRTSLLNLNPFREIIDPRRVVTTTPNPLINKTIRDLFDRQYIPEASDVKPTKELLNKTNIETTDPLRSLFGQLFNPTQENVKRDNPSIIDSIGSLFNSDSDQKNTSQDNLSPFFSHMFNLNETDSRSIVKDISDSIN